MAQRAATDAELLVLVPDAKAETDTGRRQEFLDFAFGMINLEAFGDKAHRAHAFLTGHFLALTTPGMSTRSPTTAKSIGGISASYAVGTPPADQELSSSAYGLAFLACRETLFVAPAIGGP